MKPLEREIKKLNKNICCLIKLLKPKISKEMVDGEPIEQAEYNRDDKVKFWRDDVIEGKEIRVMKEGVIVNRVTIVRDYVKALREKDSEIILHPTIQEELDNEIAQDLYWIFMGQERGTAAIPKKDIIGKIK